uniref:Uncharacterized protein n=1 Tax=Oryza punctata TaxID=4537 RepID=A0A0E0L8T4_ORYPU
MPAANMSRRLGGLVGDAHGARRRRWAWMMMDGRKYGKDGLVMRGAAASRQDIIPIEAGSINKWHDED